uniref:Keratinocyte differentiation-associated protein n=1 Tax=Capra hircus TaxID=9925 RepID=A0A8C2PKP2_CAPHI
MKIPVLPVAVLLSVLALHSAQGAALASSEVSNVTWLLLLADLLLSFFTLHPLLEKRLLPLAFKNDEFLNWHSIKRKLPFLNWDAFPKLKGLRSATPDAQ